MGLNSCLLVRDGYHIYRAKKMLEARGFKVYGSPRPETHRDDIEHWWLYLRQAAGYILWSLGLQ